MGSQSVAAEVPDSLRTGRRCTGGRVPLVLPSQDGRSIGGARCAESCVVIPLGRYVAIELAGCWAVGVPAS